MIDWNTLTKDEKDNLIRKHNLNSNEELEKFLNYG